MSKTLDMDYPYARNLLSIRHRHEILFSDPEEPPEIVMEFVFWFALLVVV
jgi:hypothetical protein